MPLLALIWQPAAEPLHIVGGAALLAALAVLAYTRSIRSARAGRWPRVGLLAMRLVVVATLAILLLGPSRVPPQKQSAGRPRLTILLDTSASMQTRDAAGKARIEFAVRQWLSADRLDQLARTHEIDLQRIDVELAPLSPSLASPSDEPGAPGTARVSRIIECVHKSLMTGGENSTGQSILLLSDGHDSTDLPPLPVALLGRARNVPIHTVCLGGPVAQRDLALVAMARQEYVLAGEPGEIVAKVFQAGMDRAATTIHLRGGKDEITRPLQFNGEPSLSVTLPVKQDKPGLYEYQVDVDPVDGEQETANNHQSVFVEVTAQRIRVAMLEGEPFWDTKFLAQSLRRDARVELTQVTQLSQTKKAGIITRPATSAPEQASPPPTTAPDLAVTPALLADFDVIILGRGVENLLSHETAQWLGQFVADHGGSVIFARGLAYDPDTPAGRQMGRDLAVIEPVLWGKGLVHNRSLALTALGRGCPCFAFGGLAVNVDEALARLPGLTVMPVVAREKTATEVLARAASPGQGGAAAADSTQAPPALVSMNYGRGRVVALLGEGLWRWSLLPPEAKDLDGVYDMFWSNTIRWLAMSSNFLPGESQALRLNRTSLNLGEPVLVDVAFRTPPPADATFSIELIGPDGKVHKPELAAVAECRRQATFLPATRGVWRVILHIPLPLGEGARVGGDAGKGEAAAIEKKFSVYDINFEMLAASANPDLMRTLAEQSGGRVFAPEESATFGRELARMEAQRLVTPQPDLAWDRAAFLLVLLLWCGAEWIARKGVGMP